ncbi:MAG: hypothetical protein RI932_1511 [Pseudomonadota bacterium]
MINSSRLPQSANINTTRPALDDAKALDRGFGKLDDDLVPSDGLLAGGMIAPTGNFGKTSSFNELLQMTKLDPKKEVIATKQDNKPAADDKGDKRNDNTDRKAKSDTGTSKKAAKETKAKGGQNQKQATDEQLALAQLLAQQQSGAFEPLKNQKENLVAANATDKLNLPKLQQQNTLQQNPNTLNEVMRNLDQKIDNLSQINSNLQSQAPTAAKDELMDLASKFDDVKFDFSTNQGQPGQLNKLDNNQALQEMQSKEMMQRLAEQEWAQNDLALRDLVSQNALQESAMEQISLDRLEAMSRLKETQLDRMQLQNLENVVFEKQLQLQELNASKQPQWQSYKELSPDELAMLDTLAGAKPETGAALGSRSESTSLNSSITSRLVGAESNAPVGKAITQDAVNNLQTLAGLASEGSPSHSQGNSGNNSSMSGNTSRGETTAMGGVTAQKTEAAKGGDMTNAAEEKKEARARESERTREMARAAALRAQSVAAELAVKGGGTAKVQIKDSQLGVVELRINMSDDNRLKVELVANSERIKQELEKQSEELKTGLEKHKLVLEGVSFGTDTKLGDSSFQNSTQSENRNQQSQQQQQQQGFNSFSQNQSSAGQQGFGQERFFQAPTLPLNNAAPVNGAAKKSYAGKNESQTNIQRNANGSLKVTA